MYGYMFFQARSSQKANISRPIPPKTSKVLADPLFIFIMICMTLTAISEFGPQQWVERILGNSGASPMLVLAMVTGIMAIGRYFAGPIVHRINPIGVLLMSAVVTTAAVYSMSIAEGSMIYLAAILFALGVCYFWPTMIGFTSEYLPKTGALGMSLVGGAGMFATSIWQPVIGGWLDTAKNEALASGLADQVAELTAGKATLGKMMFFPLAVAVLFFILFLLRKKLEERRVPQGHATEEIV
jgi:MFS family permease